MGHRRDANEIGDIPMKTSTPQEIVKAALANGELDKLLLGAPAYQYRSKYSPAPGNRDLTELLAVIYEGLDAGDGRTAKNAMTKALDSLEGAYNGIEAITACILFETGRKFDGRPAPGLHLDRLAMKLGASIRKFEARLRVDSPANRVLFWGAISYV